MTEFSKIPWICDGNRPAWLQDDDWIRLDNISLKAKYFNSWIIGDKYYFPTNHPYSICAEYNAKNPAKPQMVPWNTKQGEHVNAPEDWDEGEVLLRDGMKYRDSAYYRWGNESYAYDIVGYVHEDTYVTLLDHKGIIIPNPDPIDTAAANNNIPPDALRAALKELGK